MFCEVSGKYGQCADNNGKSPCTSCYLYKVHIQKKVKLDRANKIKENKREQGRLL